MKELDSFTVEQLNNFIESDHAQCGDVAALARIALAAKRAEESHSRREVWDGGNTWIQCSRQAYDRHEAAGQRVRVLYERPQLNSLEIPQGWKLVPIEPTQNMVDAHISGMQLAGFSRAYRDMLAAAPEPQNQQQNIPEIIPQGWIKCSDQMPEDDTLCLGVDEFGVIWTMHFDDGEWRADTGHVDDLKISHWMPLPTAPEKPL
ncbi:DUF551 domain-containing protein [Yersinia enterocolitica]